MKISKLGFLRTENAIEILDEVREELRARECGGYDRDCGKGRPDFRGYRETPMGECAPREAVAASPGLDDAMSDCDRSNSSSEGSIQWRAGCVRVEVALIAAHAVEARVVQELLTTTPATLEGIAALLTYIRGGR
jgi:hypothetical protein